MAEQQSKVAELRKWFVENKLTAVGGLWAASVVGSLAYNFSNPNMKTSVKVIHARLHAQFLTLAALAGSAAVEYYDHQSGEKAKRYEKHIQTSSQDDSHWSGAERDILILKTMDFRNH